MKASPVLSSFLVFLLLTATPLAISAANLIDVHLPEIAGFDIHGQLVCSSSPNPPATTPGISGVDVDFTCNGGSIDLGSAVTDSKGFFSAFAPIADGILTDNSQLPCSATVNLPANLECTAFPPEATLTATFDFVGTVVAPVTGLVAQVSVTHFIPQ